MFFIRKANLKILSLLFISIFGLVSFVFAANNPNFQLTINPGTLAVDVVYNQTIGGSQQYDSISSPVFSFDSVEASTNCQFGENAPGLVLGDNVLDMRGYVSGGYLYIQNPDASSDGFSVSLAPTSGKNAFWVSSSGQNSLDYNNSDCINDSTKMNYVEASGIVYGGRMYVDPSSASVNPGKSNISVDEGTNMPFGISLGSASSFQYDVVDSITLLQANSSSDDIADYLINGINISQTIPAMIPADDYSLDMTVSIISNGNSAHQSSMRSQNPITYNGFNVEGSDIYVGPNDDVELVYGGGQDLNWSLVNEGFYAADEEVTPPYLSQTYGSSVVVHAGTGNSNVKVTAEFQAKLETWYSDVNIHFGTGKYCNYGVWTSNSSDCYTNQSSCESAGYNWESYNSSCFSGSYCNWFGC